MTSNPAILTFSQQRAIRDWASLLNSPKAVAWTAESQDAIQTAREILHDGRFANGLDLDRDRMRQLFDAMRSVIWNISLARLIVTDGQLQKLNSLLRGLFHSEAPILDRIDRLAALPNVGLLTLSQFLFFYDPCG